MTSAVPVARGGLCQDAEIRVWGRCWNPAARICVRLGLRALAAIRMEDLKGFVLDQQAVVTYKWLSSTILVSADEAKRLV